MWGKMNFPIFIITGVSFCGKTSLLCKLKHRLGSSRYDFHDVDEDDWKPLGDAWDGIHDRARGFLDIAWHNCNLEPPKLTMISGIIYPERVKKFSSQYPNLEPAYCFLEIDTTTLSERLATRGVDDDEKIKLMEVNEQQMKSLRHQVENTHLYLIMKGTNPLDELEEIFIEELLGPQISKLQIEFPLQET